MEEEKGKSYKVADRGPPELEKRAKKKAGRGYKILEAISLSLVIFVVCANFAIPTLFYYIRPAVTATAAANGSSPSELVDMCLEPAVYSGATCRAELQVYQECFSGSAGSNGDILIRSDINQESVEADAELLIESGLSLLNPSAECVAAIRPFLCLYLFGVCDSSTQLRQVSSSECVDLRDDICATVWSAAVGFLGPGTLPVCEELSTLTETCMNDNSSGNSDPLPSVTSTVNASTSEIVRECRDDYYLSNDSLCLPVCGNYTEDGVSAEIRDTVITLFSSIIALICAFLVIVLSFTIQRRFMLTFPSFFLLYLCLTTVFIALVVLIGYIDKEALFCNNIDLMDSIRNPTPYCKLSGIMFNYALMQSTFWVLFHVAALFWGIAFPFHYRQYKDNGYIKYIHVATVAVAILLPLVSALAPLKDGYVPARFPPIVCTAANTDYTFYTLVFPISILLAISTCLLIITFWIILKEFVIKKISKGKKASRVGKAQVKIMFVFCYYILLGSLALGTFAYYLGVNDRLIAELQNFFLCESLGINSGRNCKELKSSLVNVFSSLSLVAIVMQGLITPVVLVFVVDFKHCKCRKNRTNTKSTSRTQVDSKNVSATNPRYL